MSTSAESVTSPAVTNLPPLDDAASFDVNSLTRRLTQRELDALLHLEGRGDANLDTLLQHLRRMLTQLERTDVSAEQTFQMVAELMPLFKMKESGPDIALDARDPAKLQSIVVLVDAILSRPFPGERPFPQSLKESSRSDHIASAQSIARSAYAVCTGRSYAPVVVVHPSPARRHLEALRNQIVSAYKDGQPEGWSLRKSEGIRKWVFLTLTALGAVKGCEYGCSAVNAVGKATWGGAQQSQSDGSSSSTEKGAEAAGK